VKLVLLHGFTGGPSVFDSVRARLPAWPTLAPWLGGHGLPPAPLGETFDDEVDRLADVVRREGFHGAVLCGYSLGARLALGLLVRHPALFARAVLVGVNPGIAREETFARAMADDRFAGQLKSEGVERFALRWADQPLFASQQRLPETDRAAEAQRRRGHDATALATALRTLSLGRMADRRPALGSIPIPVAYVAGAEDDKFAVLAQACAEATPAARAVVVPESGHNVVLERPDAVASLLEQESA